MSAAALSFISLAIVSSINLVAAQGKTFPATPLVSKHYAYPSGIPYKADTDVGLARGNQLGYNICNSTTQNQNSLCQTGIFNAVDDFCLWGPNVPGQTIGQIEGNTVAWCSKPGHGTRLIPEGALTGLQFLKTPDYIQVVGFIDQTKIDMVLGDSGGEMDPHGADLRGNPMGGLMYSNAFTGAYVQVIEWTNFMGANTFCLKACDPSRPNASSQCQHIYDRIGCAYNAPNAAKNNIFESCAADSADPPGVYTDARGQLATYSQPPESLGAISTIPYTARVPKSSSCRAYSSKELFLGLPTVTASATARTTSVPGLRATAGATTKTTGTPGATNTAKAGAKTTGKTSGATSLAISGVSLLGVFFSAFFLS